MRQLFGSDADVYSALLKRISPEFEKINVEFPFGRIYAREKILDARTREMLTIAALTVQGYSLPQLAIHTKAALQCGVSKKEILEIIIQMIAYAGFPAATNALFTVDNAFKQFDEHKSKVKKVKNSRGL